MKLICQNCEWEWEYKGEAKYYTGCPRCHYNVNIKKQKEKEE